MKQLLIVNKAKDLNAGTSVSPYDLSGLDAGAITFFELGASSLLSAPATKNFAVALGQGTNINPFLIPEIDINTLTITKALPVLGTAVKRKFTFPTPVVGKEYTVLFVKKGTVPHERNTWYCSIVARTTTASTEASKLVTTINAKVGEYITASNSGADVTMLGNTIGEGWEITLVDSLAGVSFAGSTDKVDATPTIGDKAYIQDLASRCAAGKGFTDTDAQGREVYPGYPEAVEDLTPNSTTYGSSTEGYAVFTLRFQVGRDSAKTRDEKVWQLVHIAVPVSNSDFADIAAILPTGKFSDNIAKALADAEIVAKVKDTALKE